MQTEIVYGYGLNLDGLRINAVKTAISSNHLLTMKKLGDTKLIDNFDDTDWLEDYLDFEYISINSGDQGAGALIADILYKETAIRFEFRKPQEDIDSDGYIIFPEVFPWQLNPTEKELTQGRLDEILNGIADELNLEARAEEVQLEYFE